MITRVYGSVLYGVEAFLTTVEVSVSKGLGYQITGLADESIKKVCRASVSPYSKQVFVCPGTNC